jgi:hypothetical protein
MRQPALIVDALYEMTMQRIGDLRCDAAQGRDLKRSAGDSRDRVIEPVVTTSSTICVPRPDLSN